MAAAPAADARYAGPTAWVVRTDLANAADAQPESDGDGHECRDLILQGRLAATAPSPGRCASDAERVRRVAPA